MGCSDTVIRFCLYCGCGKMAEGTTSYCATHNYLRRREEKKARKDAERLAKRLAAPKKIYSPPKKVSQKQKEKNAEYSAERKEWLIGKKCVVFPEKDATTVHHGKGRIGYADDWARQKGITLLMDKRYWIPASMEGHEYIERNPDTAKREGWSWSRLENLDQEKETI
ncbi:MAG: hypothetical protein BWY15_02066 [Firmicutes bacterium ADurb.Bin193]|nr:MAG: hypothetical protein BWY15_02066 [Firmicutes bacterium ADurb.Bin193]